MPQISIIVPVYNVEPYLRRCVDSILAQTYTDFELILVDDGSPDRCPAICDAYAQQDSRVHVIHQENGGVSKARNIGIDTASGSYLLFCDSDDYVSPEWCSSMLTCVNNDHQNYIFCDHICEYEARLNNLKCDTSQNIQELPIQCFVSLQTKSKVGYVWNVLFYADIVRKYNLHFTGEAINEDLSFCIQYLNAMNRLTFVGNAPYHYMQCQQDSLSRKYHQDGFRKWQEKYAMLQEFVDQKIPQQQQEESRKCLADYYLYFFLDSLNNTFDSRSTLSRIEKMRYNCKAVHSNEFQHCLQYTDGKQEDPRYIWMLKNLPYPFAYGYIQCVKYKQNLSQKQPNSIKEENAYGPKKK